MLFWAAYDQFTAIEDQFVGVAYDPVAGTWRTLPLPADTTSTLLAPVAWTGNELVVCCGDNGVAQAYNPATNRWRVLPAPPHSGYGSGVWADDQVLLVTEHGAAAYDPGSDSWADLPPPPTGGSFFDSEWTGDRWIVWPAPPTRTTYAGATFDPMTQEWEQLPPPPDGSWPAIAEINLGGHSALWTGSRLLVYVGPLASGRHPDGVLLSLDPVAGAWEVVDEGRAASVPETMVGDDLLSVASDGTVVLGSTS